MELRITDALFDFDGTVSLVREGWQPIMTDMMVSILMQTPEHGSQEELVRSVRAYVDELTGKQTMYQMIRLAEEVEKRGGKPDDPANYKRHYVGLIEAHIADRLDALASGRVQPADFLVPGAKAFLEELERHGVALYLASGTDEEFVIREATLLGIASLFDTIAGAQKEYLTFSKRIAIERILREKRIDGSRFAVFGDGFVEIEEAKRVGGLAVGVASDEAARSGKTDPWKEKRLVRAGADLIVPDFADPRPIWELLRSR